MVRLTFARVATLLLLMSWSAACATALGGAHVEDAPAIQPDRPDVTNAAATVPTALLQIETGGQGSRVPVSGQQLSTPVSARVGCTDWFEARLDTDGATREKAPEGVSTGFAGLAVGGKIRLVSESERRPALALEPAVTLPWGRGAGGGTDYAIAVLASHDLLGGTHLDLNYGIAAIASDGSHFVQHLVSASGNVQVGQRWSPYAEVYWLSKAESSGRHVLSLDAGAIYTVSERFALDGGIAWGLGAWTGRPSIFGGLSVIVGEVAGHQGVHARLLHAQAHGGR